MNPVSLEWLKSARDDLSLIEHILLEGQLTHMTAFHAQQAVEKALKALLESQNKDVPKPHSLIKLFDLTSKYIHRNNTELIHSLDGLYIESRYPGDFGLMPNGKPTLEEARQFFDFATSIFDEVTGVIENK